MTGERPLSLLKLAIAASAAIVPVLLAVLLAVVLTRGADEAVTTRTGERHVSVRHVAALKTFEYGIVRRDHINAPTPSADALVERVPQCRREWAQSGGALAFVRSLAGKSADAGSSPAARMAVQLGEIDRALLAFSSVDNRRVTDRVGLDGARWLDAVISALETPIEAAESPGHRFTVKCPDVALAVSTLARSNGRLLGALAWRGTEVERVVGQWRPDQYVQISQRLVARANPWAGIPGCIYLNHAPDDVMPSYVLASARGLDDMLCSRPEMFGADVAGKRFSRIAGGPQPDLPVGDARWRVPPSLDVILQPLEALHQPGGALYRAYAENASDGAASDARTSNRVDIGANPVDVGFSIDLTIDPELQALAQRTAACYTGRDDVCRALGMTRKEDGAAPVGHALLEHAMVRMAAIAIIDVETGRIEALAGALSPCTREEYDGPGRSPKCDRRLPYPIRYRPDALLNPAVFHDAMPASTIKPIMAAAFLSDPEVGARWLQDEQSEIARNGNGIPSTKSLRAELMRSDSARFLDRMFCADKGFAPCARPWAIQSEAALFGWNGGCIEPREDCGKRDLLFGRSVDARGDGDGALAFEVSYGRLLVEPLDGDLTAPFHLRPAIGLDSAKVRRCAAGPDGRWPSKDDWEKCGGGVIVDVVAEGWGQGHARASALGGAGMMAALAAAANGQAERVAPHIVDAIRGTTAKDAAKPASIPFAHSESQPTRIAPDAASVILNGLSYGPRAGTSRRACDELFDAKTCAGMDFIAGKTGTPTFPNDDRSLDELARLCPPNAHSTKRERMACGPLKPYKWFVAAYKTDRTAPRWNKAIGVLTERNWFIDSGRIHGAGDHGPNPAAEIAMQIVARQVGMLPWSEP
jgi:hypothetical protein